MDEKIIQFIKSCAYDYDCDNDAHRYGTACRACEAKKLLKTELPNKIIRVSDGVEVKPIIAFKCPHCGENLEVPNYLIGKEIECGACCNEFPVPDKSDEPDGWEGDLTNQL